jgi:carbon-monoxide dehydrogenase medium subunit
MQVPAPVEYERATTVEHALSLLTAPDARVIAGGHSLIPMMKLRLAQPELVVDINDLTELSFIKYRPANKNASKNTTADGELCIGALITHADLLAHPQVAESFPIFTDAERVIADPIVRNWGTIGGSLCQADPSEDLSAAFAATRATAVIRTKTGTRLVPVREFHSGPYETVIGPGELLTEVRVPVLPGAGSAYQKVERRSGDWSIAAVGAVLAIDRKSNVITAAGIGLTAVGAEHFFAAQAEEELLGKPADEASFAEAASIAARHCRPVADQRGPEDYKRHLVAELTVRALRSAARRAAASPAATARTA